MNLPEHLKPPPGGYRTLKTTPDINAITPPITADELEDFKIIWAYEQAVEQKRTPQPELDQSSRTR